MTRRKKTKTTAYSMFGYMKSDPDVVGWLAFTKSRFSRNTYEITEDSSQAAVFPAENDSGSPDFGSPAQWLEFFGSDPELSDWKFHLLPARSGTTADRPARRKPSGRRGKIP